MLRMNPIVLGLAVGALVPAGCGSPYVNIPAQVGDVATHNPNDRNVRGVLAAALEAVLDQQAIDGPVAVSLPEGASPLTHADVAQRLGEQAISTFEEGAEPLPIVAVQEVRIRGVTAEVDVVCPSPSGRDQLMTAYLRWEPLSGWRVRRVRTWRRP